MAERNLHFEELSVHQALGIRHGDGFKIEDLSDCINIIHGRNGSGKSTTARVIHELLWPGKTELERPSVSGLIREDDRLWEILVEPGHREWRLNGTVESSPEVGPPEIRHRYRLALEELVGGEDQQFAKEIADASLGGFDLEAAVKSASFTKAPTAKNIAAAAKEADSKWRAATDKHRAIQTDEGKSADLKRKAEAAKAAHDRLPQLERVRDFRDSQRELEGAKARLDGFPAEIGQLLGNEREELDRLHKLQDQASEASRAAERNIEEARNRQAKAGVEDGDAAKEICDQLKSQLPKLQRLENAIEQERREASQARGEATSLRQRLGGDLNEDQIGRLSSAQFPEVSDFARQVIDFMAARRMHAERIAALKKPAGETTPAQSYEKLHEGIRSLREWLACPEDQDADSTSRLLPLILSLATMALLSIYLGVANHPVWFVGALAAAGLAYWDHRQRQPTDGRPPAGARAVHEADYNRSGLGEISEWSASVVGDRLRELADLALKRKAEDERLRHLAQLEAQSEQLKKDGETLENRRRELTRQLGPEIEMSDDWLPRFIENLTQWQQKSTAVAGHEQSMADLQEQRTGHLAEMNKLLSGLGLQSIDSHESAGRSINELDAALNRRREAVRDEAEARRELQRAKEQSADASEGLAKIHARFGLEPEKESHIDTWLAQRTNYQNATAAVQKAEAVLQQRQRDIADFPDPEGVDVDAEIEESRALADTWETLRDEITSIQLRVENAKAGHELTDALDNRERRLQELQEIQGSHFERAAGKCLAEWVRVQSTQGTRPAVFNRARELFRKFTNNRLQLDMDDRSNPPKFIARRSETSADPVENLSVGERMQLLIAVRLAFIELNETIKLPLLLDEVLGTSDDERAAAIIDTVISIACEGRQVFYFTAQLDEVGKWVTRLNETSTQHRIVDLDHVRDTTSTPARPIPASPVQFMPPPRPSGDTHAEYGRKLRITLFDPWDETSVGLHLWHVVDDVPLLYKLLRKQVTSWWQLQQMPEEDREKLFPGCADSFTRAKAAAKAIETACRTWRIGRGRRVTRQVLYDSKVITDHFMNDVVKLAESVDGRAEDIIAGLKNRLVRGWHKNKTHELNSYFHAHSFLVESQPQKRTDILRRVFAALSDELDKKLLADEKLHLIVNSLPDLDD